MHQIECRFSKFSPEPLFWRGGVLTREGEDPIKFPRQIDTCLSHRGKLFWIDFTLFAHICPADCKS